MLERLYRLFETIPHDLIALVARVSAGTIFWRSGWLKLEGWESGTTVALFENEYRLPVLPPDAAAVMATGIELTIPLLLFAGFGTRLAAAVLLSMTLVIQLFVYPNAFDTHGVWVVAFLYLMKFGAGRLSFDWLLSRARPGTVHEG